MLPLKTLFTTNWMVRFWGETDTLLTNGLVIDGMINRMILSDTLIPALIMSYDIFVKASLIPIGFIIIPAKHNYSPMCGW